MQTQTAAKTYKPTFYSVIILYNFFCPLPYFYFAT